MTPSPGSAPENCSGGRASMNATVESRRCPRTHWRRPPSRRAGAGWRSCRGARSGPPALERPPRGAPGLQSAVQHRGGVAQVVQGEEGARRRHPARVAVHHHAAVVGDAHGLERLVQRLGRGELAGSAVALGDDAGEGEEARPGDVPRVVARAVAAHVQDHGGGVGEPPLELRHAHQQGRVHRRRRHLAQLPRQRAGGQQEQRRGAEHVPRPRHPPPPSLLSWFATIAARVARRNPRTLHGLVCRTECRAGGSNGVESGAVRIAPIFLNTPPARDPDTHGGLIWLCFGRTLRRRSCIPRQPP